MGELSDWDIKVFFPSLECLRMGEEGGVVDQQWMSMAEQYVAFMRERGIDPYGPERTKYSPWRRAPDTLPLDDERRQPINFTDGRSAESEPDTFRAYLEHEARKMMGDA